DEKEEKKKEKEEKEEKKKEKEEKEKEEKEKEEKEKEEKEKDEKEKEEKEKEEKEKEENRDSKTSYLLDPTIRPFYPSIKQIVIPEIYQSVFNGEKYRFNNTNPNDGIQVDERENKNVFAQQNYDGSWRIDGGSPRIDIHTKDAGIIPDKPLQLNNMPNGINVQSWNFSELKDVGYWYKPSDWKNVEITLIFKLVDSLRSKGEQHSVSLVTRSISHSQLDNDYKKSKNEPQFFCGGSSYHNNLSSDGKVRMKKEQFHIDYEWERYNPNMSIGDLENIYHKKVGFKGIVYNINETAVKLESWVDIKNGGKGPYKKVHEFIDNGNWGDAMTECGAKTVGQAITWGSPTVIIKANDFKLDIFDIEVREIIPPHVSYPFV
ncbi:MAG TPA: hypothetical protein VFV86_08530, partial [Nitrososphaeraceae archaeon]|nr:hypothetical protein [Nitrososphaeraceae archaeon]